MCTTILVTRGATSDGSTFVSHSDDDDLGDQRLVYVPARDHPPGSERMVYECITNFPRLVTDQLGPGYDTPGLPESRVLGTIPQVEHTYAYFDGNYGIINEHQLAFGECTDNAHKFKDATPTQGTRMFYSAELSRVALERCKTARGACQLMGQLIDDHGIYNTGETLLVADRDEGFVFEMAPAPQGGDLWVAQRVPDGEVFVAANEFRIREIEDNSDDFIFKKGLREQCQQLGWWSPDRDGEFDWCRAVSHGEYNHPYYSLRRVWSVMNRLNPSLKLSPRVEDGFTKAYPFSIKPADPLGLQDVMALHRDHYEGTEFDTTRGIAAGPFGNPNRYYDYTDYDGHTNDAPQPGPNLKGAFERPVSVYYCGYSFINHIRPWLPDAIGGVCWFGPDQPASTCYTPFYCGVSDLPAAYQQGDTATFDRDVAFWVFNFLANYACLKYCYMIKDIVALQQQLENQAVALVAATDAAAQQLADKHPEMLGDYLARFCSDQSAHLLDDWRALTDRLIQKYSDGFQNHPAVATEVGYPEWWRDQVGYADGPKSYGAPG